MEAACVIKLGKKVVPLRNCARAAGSRQRLDQRMREMANDLEFRRKWKKATMVELWSNAAILRFEDGTKWYMQIS